MKEHIDFDRPDRTAIEGDARRVRGALEFFRDGAWRRLDNRSSDPRHWSWDKLSAERRNGMPAVVAEFERRTRA